MKCAQVQRRLLGTENVSRPATEVEAHLSGCSVCREFQRRLLHLEANVPRIPLPATSAKADLLAQLHGTLPMAATHKTAKSLARSAAWRWWIGGVAAAVLLICTGLFLGDALWNSIHPEPPERAERNRDGDGEQAGQKKQPIAVDNANKNPKPAAPKTLVSRLIQCDLRLAQGGSPQARIEALSDLAANLQSETFSLVHAAPGKNLEQLAWLYQKVVRDGVVSRCRNLPLGERRKVLPSIVKEFTRVEREASRLARQKPASAKTLRIIASAARAGKGQLRQILERKS